MFNYGSVTNPRRAVLILVTAIVAATMIVLVAGVRSSSAQEADIVTAALSSSDDQGRVEELEAALAEANQRLIVLEEQLGFARQAALQSEQRVDSQRDTILTFQDSGRYSDGFQAVAIEEWRIGYTIGGGRNLAAFENVILPCESGGEQDPDAAIGRTDDWGRAQINR
ncbi:MAG: hypothetical protein ACR2P0_17420, partial [Acidimicrobiales bacterium]